MTESISASAASIVANLVRQISGIQLDTGKTYLITSRLTPLLGEFAVKSLDDLAAALKRDPHGRLAEAVVEALTTNETLFFRDARPWEALRKEILPGLIRLRANERSLSIWCGAASSGQEPYSLAMLLRRHFPELSSWKLRLLATDLSEAMLERCREGLYSSVEVGRGLDPEFQRAYFRSEGTGWRLDAGIRAMVELRRQNLTQSFSGLGSFDLVLLRNVLIYFDEATKLDILRRVRQVLTPGGVLMLGATEMTNAPDFERSIAGDCRILRRAA